VRVLVFLHDSLFCLLSFTFRSATEYGYTDGESNHYTDCSAIYPDANSGPNGNTNHGAHRRSYFCPDGQANDCPERAADAVSADYKAHAQPLGLAHEGANGSARQPYGTADDDTGSNVATDRSPHHG
jgi:hypothetical protein